MGFCYEHAEVNGAGFAHSKDRDAWKRALFETVEQFLQERGVSFERNGEDRADGIFPDGAPKQAG
jgi:hypothetical protein